MMSLDRFSISIAMSMIMSTDDPHLTIHLIQKSFE